MNLMNMAMKYAGPMVAQQIANKLGIGGPVVNKLIAAALPAILGGVIGKSKTSGGLGSLMNLVTGAQTPEPNALETMFQTGGDIDGLAKSGGGMLEGLLGGQGMGALSSALGKHAGVEQSQAGSLLGMLAPAALGTISAQVAENKMDGPALATFLKGQEANVAKAMPADFAKQLGGTDLLDGFSTNLGDAANMAQDTVQKSSSKLPLIIGAAAIAAAAWYFLAPKGDAPMDGSSMESLQEFKVGDVDLGGEFNSVTSGLTDTFTGITDTASAQAAVPQLTELSGKLGSLSETAGQLSGPAQTGFQGMVSTALSALRPVVEGAIESSGAGGILQPIADQILGSLEGMAG